MSQTEQPGFPETLQVHETQAAEALKELTVRPSFGFSVDEVLSWPKSQWGGFTGTYELDSNENLCAKVMVYLYYPETSPNDTFEGRKERLRQALLVSKLDSHH